MNIKRFGTKVEDQDYKVRIGVYALIFNQDKTQLLVVSPPNGSYLLPGGEMEGLETQAETLHREVMEELGFIVEIGMYLGEAEDYYYSTFRKQYYHNPGYFYMIDSWKEECPPLEDFNRLEWMNTEVAIERLKRGSHKWAIQHYLELNN
ncbi:NUDIX hydrolase [Carnobacterium gallinarum]|uniref:NUDIX hydrolase n=1 Tax=Carnobacterium gallinarum TaxID=2749 RepID=UPI00054D39E6|nr:NUDIX hydrolase [Carnobacterium gallinarum]